MEKLNVKVCGENKSYDAGTTYAEVAAEYQGKFNDDIMLVDIEGGLKELSKNVSEGDVIEFVTAKDHIGRKTYRRSVSLLLQKALDNLEEGLSQNLYVMYSIGQGYFCKIKDRECNKDFLLKLKIEMLRLVDEDIPLKKETLHVEEAIAYFEKIGYQDKAKLLKFRRSSSVNIYDLDGTKDYFFGYMVNRTGLLSYFDLMEYDDGFMLLFPDKNTKLVAPFEERKKFYETMKESSEWSVKIGIDTVGALNEAISKGKARDIILMQEALMEDNIGNIATEIVSDSRRKCILIAGPSSSGKTSFSHRLSNQLRARGITPHPIPLDMYYLDHAYTPLDEEGKPDYECLEALDVELFNQNVTDLLAGKKVEIPSYNFKTGKREYKGNYLQIGDNDILVIEGIHGLNDKMTYAIPNESKYKIYISALTQLSIDEHNPLPTTDGRLLRRIVRDARTRGSSAKETIGMWKSVRRGEENYIFPFQEKADVVFNSATLYEMAVLKIYAEPQLFAIKKNEPEYKEAKRLLKLLDYFLPVPPEDIANNSLVREFIGGSIFPV